MSVVIAAADATCAFCRTVATVSGQSENISVNGRKDRPLVVADIYDR